MTRFAAFLIFALPLTVYAGGFSDLAQDIAKKCNIEKATCSSPYTVKVVKSGADEKLDERLEAEAKSAARIWGDTILEGDYYAFGDTRVGRALEISKDGKVIAYHVEYYEEAIDTGSDKCVHDEDQSDQAWAFYGECTLGRIYEAVYVSADFKDREDDYERSATFFSSPQEKREKGYQN